MAARNGWDPVVVAQWQRILRDLLAYLIAAFLFVFGALTVHEVNVLAAMFGAGLVLLGLPSTIRLDRSIHSDEKGSGK